MKWEIFLQTFQARTAATDSLYRCARYLQSAMCIALLGPTSLFAAPAFVQQSYSTPQTPQSTVTAAYLGAQVAGNLNVVVVGWSDSTSHVSSVTDFKGNAYSLAVGPTVQSGTATQSIYYATNVAAAAAGTNIVSVQFDAPAKYVDLRIAEYSSVATSAAVDVTAAAMGNAGTSDSGAVTTTNDNDLLVGANLVQSGTSGAGAGYTSRVITNPDSDNLEDRVVSATGSYGATAPLTGAAAWIMQMVAFRAATGGSGGGDTQAPTAPSNLAATAISNSQISLSWTVSTDNVGVTSYLIERCAGAGCANFAQVATATGTSYSNIGLTASTSYSYRVRATDAAANLSPYSGTASAITQSPDSQAPTAPSNLVATVVSSSQINLSWTASTDNVGVTSYLIERCAGAGCANFAQVAIAAGTSYSNTGLTASTSYSYRVRTTDAASNLSAYSGSASGTTQAAQAAPLAYVQGANAVPQSPQTTMSVRYARAQTAGNLNVVAIGWFSATSHILSVTDTSGNAYVPAVGPTIQAQAGTQAIFYAANIDPAGANANQVTVTFDGAVPFPDVRIAEYSGVDPLNPIDTVAAAAGTSATSSSGAVTTTNANDLLVGANYVTSGTNAAGSGFTSRVITSPDGDILEDRIVTATGTYGATASLSPSGSWIMQMVAFRAASAGGSGDTQAPTAPSNLAATAVASSQINLSWAASTDNVGVTGYLIERCAGTGCSSFTQIATATSTTYSNTGLSASTSYSYRVHATDAANNLSAYSATVRATTSAAIDIQAPSAPTNLVATAVSTTQVNLSWTASTDNVGVTNYLIERCAGTGCSDFAQIATATGTTYSGTGLTAATSYSYRVRATDAASNLSGYSGIATAVTQSPDTQAPTAPTNLAATSVASNQINLSWTASTDNVGVTAYRVERCQGAGCATFVQIGTTTGTTYGDVGLTASTTYSYRARATDAAGNLGPYSATATGVTQAAPNLPPLAYVQGSNAVPQTAQSSVNASFAGLQSAGNLNVVAVGWFNTTAQVVSVTDTAGNTYTLAAGPTTQTQAGTQAMYYAPNVKAAAGGNRVTVAFNSAVPYADLRIAEYAGVDPSNPIDTGAEATGTSTVSNSGAFVTGHPYDVLIGANYVTTSTTAPGAGFTKRMITAPDGSILEDHVVTVVGSYSATAQLISGSWIMQAVAFRGGIPPGADTTPPTASMTAPVANATLSGTVTFSASASDLGGSGLGGVQFQVDGINVGPADTNAPYSISFNTAQFANGTHTITAYAWDGAHNVTVSASVTVTFNNTTPGNPAQAGLWSGPFAWPLVAIHLNLLSDGRILTWDQFATGNPVPQVWDPVTSGFTPVQTNDSDNLFCSGHLTLADGRLLVGGGEVFVGTGIANSDVGLTSAHIFDPVTNQWSSAASMSYGRWYPNLTTMPDGRVFTIAGETTCFGCNATVPEIYDPVANAWSQISQASRNIPWYPYTYVLPDGRIIVAGSAESPMATSAYNPATKSWATIDSRVLDAGSSAMFLPGKFIKSGTASTTEDPIFSPSSATTYMLDMTAQNPSWQQIAPMAFPRTYHVMTTLPDGTVLVTGGGRTNGFADITNAVYQAEVWSPTSQTWSTMSSMTVPRLYHQTATLLPDGRVLVTGSGRGYGRADPTDQLSAELFAPPYLFKGPRPVITSTPAQLTTGQVFTVQTPDAARIAKVALIRVGSVTHTFNMDQRYVPMSFTAGSGSLAVTAPANANLAPPGYYMLFLVDTSGIPSVAKIVRF